jgi:hypothetical protein
MDGMQGEASAGAGTAADAPSGAVESKAVATERMPDIIDLFGRRLMIGLALAGALPALAIWARPEPKHFEAFVANGELIRVNTRTGTIVACNTERCMQVLERGQKLQSRSKGALFQAPAATAPALAPPGGSGTAPMTPAAPPAPPTAVAPEAPLAPEG